MSKNKNEDKQANFQIQNIYVKDLSFEAPNNPEIFQIEWQPKVDFDININVKELDDVNTEVSLQATLKSVVGEKVAFLAEVNQAGIFLIENFPEEQLATIKNINCPTLLFPYVSENLANLINRGGFPSLHLPPVDFASLYNESLNRDES